LHIVPVYGQGNAGQHRCELITAAFRERLQKKRRALLRTLVEKDFAFDVSTSLVQLYLLAPDRGVLSVAVAPLPLEARRNVWPFARGELPVAVDKAAPSRAFAKVIEAEQRLGLRIAKGETCVDLGASPGSWSYVAVHRGAHVTSIDRSPLRDDLMRHPRLTFQQGDAFKFKPTAPVDWLLCDVIAAPERNIGLLLDWLRGGHARRFIVSIKFKGDSEYPLLDPLKAELPALCREFYLTRLCANKNEVCAFGVAKG
jgi:23S rRNA (cytidine2498-2'-O)-methyltransferase